MSVPTIHAITRWRKEDSNEFNELNYGPGEEVNAFWIDDQREANDQEASMFGREVMLMARVLSDVKLFELDDRVQFSALADSDIDKSFLVKRVKFVENGRQTSRLFTAIVGTP